MTQTAIPSVFWEEELREEKPVELFPTPSDPSHLVVSRFLPIEGKEVIGHVHVIYDKDEIWYVCTNRKNREIFPPTSDFGLVETRFQRYAHLLALQQRMKNQRRLINKNFNIKNLKPMKTNTQNPQQKMQKENQLRFIEYERATGDGHFLTITDSYHNVLGRVHKSFNDETKKYEYIAFDHAGNVFSKSDKLWNVKKEYINNREQLMEQAHQRRIQAKQQPKEVAAEKPQPSRASERRNEIADLRGEKTGRGRTTETEKGERSEAKSDSRTSEAVSDNTEDENNQQERENELADLRDSQDDDDRGDQDIDF